MATPLTSCKSQPQPGMSAQPTLGELQQPANFTLVASPISYFRRFYLQNGYDQSPLSCGVDYDMFRKGGFYMKVGIFRVRSYTTHPSHFIHRSLISPTTCNATWTTYRQWPHWAPTSKTSSQKWRSMNDNISLFRLEMVFSDELPLNLSVLILASYPKELSISKTGKPAISYLG